MPYENPPEWLEERPTALFVSVAHDGRAWRVLIAETGYTMSERLNARRIAEIEITNDRAAQLRTKRELLAEMASILIDVADGIPVGVPHLLSL